MRTLKKASIRRFLPLLIIIAIIAAYAAHNKYEQSRQLQALVTKAKIMGDRNAAALSFGQSSLGEQNLDAFQIDPAITMACLYDSKDAFFAHYFKPGLLTRNCPSDLNERALIVGGRMQVLHRIELHKTQIGSIYVESSLEGAE